MHAKLVGIALEKCQAQGLNGIVIAIREAKPKETYGAIGYIGAAFVIADRLKSVVLL